jgi:hypothetical protein
MSVPATGYGSTFAHDSIFGWMNLFKRYDQRFIWKQGERPPYPIIIDQPSFGQVIGNFNKADFGAVLASGFVGTQLSIG